SSNAPCVNRSKCRTGISGYSSNARSPSPCFRLPWRPCCCRRCGSSARFRPTAKSDWSQVMELGLDGKTAIITGGGEGIGFAAAARIAQEGGNVVIVGRRKDVLEKAA